MTVNFVQSYTQTIMAENPTLSIHDIPLPTTGGIPARLGFDLQDHVGATYCIRMISQELIKEVWNEAHDDVILIWQSDSSEEVEFIQVKGADHDQLWSVALLCQRNSSAKKPEGTSVFERSLSNHACKEPCRFRIVSTRDVMDELRPLIHALNSPKRDEVKDELAQVSAKIAAKIKDFRSPNGADAVFWVSRTVWEPVHTVDALRRQNLSEFEKQLEKLGHPLFSDQREELYQKLVRKIWDAAKSSQLEQKRIRRTDFLVWLAGAVNYFSPSVRGGQKVQEKMKSANLPTDSIQAANESRMRYRARALRDRYSDPLKRSSVEAEVAARLSMLRARLDAGVYEDDGPSFYSRCLDTLEELFNTNPDAQQLSLDFLHGCMYSMMDRCAHRLRRVTQ